MALAGFTASRLSPFVLSVVCLLVMLPCLLLQQVTAVLIYDRQTLLDFHDSIAYFCVCNSGERFFNPQQNRCCRWMFAVYRTVFFIKRIYIRNEARMVEWQFV